MIQNYNLHTHTYRCKHASGDVIDYGRAALSAGLDVLGMSDHTPLPDQRWLHVRMEWSEMLSYCRAIDQARCDLPELTILKGMECEFAPEYVSFYQDILLGELGFDYLIGGAHFVPYQGEWINVFGGINTLDTLRAYADYCVATMEAGLFAFLAHPDLFANSYPCWDADAAACSRDILQAAETLNVPLEINGYGLRKPPIVILDGLRPMYPWPPFWELAAEYRVRVLVNSDAHRPQDIVADIGEGRSIAERYGLTLARIESLFDLALMDALWVSGEH